jgi:hypothetical protein
LKEQVAELVENFHRQEKVRIWRPILELSKRFRGDTLARRNALLGSTKLVIIASPFANVNVEIAVALHVRQPVNLRKRWFAVARLH